MTHGFAPTAARPLALEGASLLAPGLQSEPIPIQPVQPAPCSGACPAGINVKAYVSLIAERRFDAALEVVRQACPLPGICGRICHSPCELVCSRAAHDQPVAIRALKRFVADQARGAAPARIAPTERIPLGGRGSKVAVIGAGPAGLTAAYDLRRAGYPVKVFEAEPEPGGMLRYGITAYRLPRDVLSEEIEQLCRAGIEIETGRRLGEDFDLDALRARGYLATLLAVGAQQGRQLSLPEAPAGEQVEDALAFLRRLNAGDRRPIEGRVLVIGGGSTAVEAARSARRLGATSVDILYRRYRSELLAAAEEIEAAEAEGIAFRFLVTPTRALVEDGRLRGLVCQRVGLGEPDASGRRRPIAIPGSDFELPAERVLVAVGQQVDLDFLPAELQPELAGRGLLRIDPESTMTAQAGLFAAGDAVSGPATVVEAIAAGHRAAADIRRYLETGRPLPEPGSAEAEPPPEFGLPEPPPMAAARSRPGWAGLERGREFREVEQVFGPEQAVAEARRCLRCGPCGDCRICAPSCQRRHVMLQVPGAGGAGATALLRAPGNLAMGLGPSPASPARLLPESRPRLLSEVGPDEGQAVELLPVRAHVQADLCRACGLCVEACPFDAIQITPPNGRPATARVEPALCRGCNLCHAVCPTGAATPTALSPAWWQARVDAIFPRAVETLASETPAPDSIPPAGPVVVLACQRRAGAIEQALAHRPLGSFASPATTLDYEGRPVALVALRCAGQLQAGMLLELCQRGARAVLVAGCGEDRCRYDRGADMGGDQVARARILLGLLGQDPDRIAADWSPSRAGDGLGPALARRLEQRAGPIPARAPQPGGAT